MLLTTNRSNRSDVEECIIAWNKTTQDLIPDEKKLQIGRELTAPTLATVMSLRGCSLVDTSPLIRVNLKITVENELLKAIQ